MLYKVAYTHSSLQLLMNIQVLQGSELYSIYVNYAGVVWRIPT